MSKVTVYGKPGCRACKGTVRQLEKHNVEFSYVDVMEDSDALSYVKDQGVVAMPYIESPVGSWSGLDEGKIAELVELR